MIASPWNKLSLVILVVSTIQLSGCGKSGVTPEVRPCRQQFESGRQKFERKKYLQAVEEFKLVLFNCPGATLVDTAQYFLALSYYNTKDYTTAAGEFRKVLNSFPTSDLADDALFMLGLSDYQQSPKPPLDQTYTLKALEQFQDFLDIYPTSPLASEAQKYLNACRDKLAEKAFRAGKLYLRMKYYGSSRIYFNEVLFKYGDSNWAVQAQFHLAESYRLERQSSQALAEYQKFLDTYQDAKLSDQSRKRIAQLKESQPEKN